jgi:hypothetical protein
MRKFFRAWGTMAPVYVTRTDIGGYSGTYSMGIGWTLLVQLLALANAYLWGVVGLITGVRVLL